MRARGCVPKKTILHRGARPLEGFDPDLVDLLVKRTREVGIRVEVDTEVRGIEALGADLVVHGARRGQDRHFEADIAVHSAGRVPEIDDLDLQEFLSVEGAALA